MRSSRDVLLAAFLVLAPIAAQTARLEVAVVPRDPDANVTLVFDATPGANRPGAYGFATAVVENRDSVAHDVEVSSEQQRRRGSAHVVRQSATLPPGAKVRWTLPLPCASERNRPVRLTVDGMSSLQYLAAGPGLFDAAWLMITDDKASAARWAEGLAKIYADALAAAAPRSGGKKARPAAGPTGEIRARTAEDLPEQWQWLTGMDVIIVDERAANLVPARQQILRDYVLAGGQLVLLSHGMAPAGPLDKLSAATLSAPAEAPADGAAAGRLGFGSWLAFDGDVDPDAAHAAVYRWITKPATGLATTERMARSGPVTDDLHDVLMIPGLGEVPVRAFLLLIVAFVLVVAVQGVRQLRRRKSSLKPLLTVPATGLVFTAAILGYGFLSEGFGVSGVVRSVTLLDQRNHEAVAWAGRTLYAGLSPSRLVTSPGTALLAWQADYNSNHRIEITADRPHEFDGMLLPSRTPTALATVTQGPARERLRFKRRNDGLELLAGPELQPAHTAYGELLVVRDAEGQHFALKGDSRLVAIPREEAASKLEQMQQVFEGLARDPRRGANRGRMRVSGVSGSGRPAWLPAEVRPGWYVGIMSAAPGFDDLGLSVDVVSACHLVRGTLADEDIQ